MKKRIASLFMAIVMIASLGVNAMALDPVTITTSGVQKFDDVPTTHWAFAYVDKVTAAGMFHGLTPTWFGPSDNMTRAQFVTVLARMEGQGALESVPTDTKFSDVERTYRFAGPIAWATNTGIVEGYSDGTFRPTQAISRAQFAAMIHRYINYKKYDQTLANGKVLSLNVVNPEPAQFPDYEQVSDVFKADVDYARTHGLVQGFGDGTLRPNIAINRAQIAAILARFIDVLTDSGYLPFLDGGDARNPIVIRNSTTTYTGGGGGGGGGGGNNGGSSAATYTLTVRTEGIDTADYAKLKHGYNVDEGTAKPLAARAAATAPIAQGGEVIFGVTPPDGKKLARISAAKTTTGTAVGDPVTLTGSSLSGYSNAWAFTMDSNITVTVTFEDAQYFYVMGIQGGQQVANMNLLTTTYGPSDPHNRLDENTQLASAFKLLYGGPNAATFNTVLENGLLAKILDTKSQPYPVDLSKMGGKASTQSIEPVISSLVAKMAKVDFSNNQNAKDFRDLLALAAVDEASANRAFNQATLTQIGNETGLQNFIKNNVDTSGVKFAATVTTSPSTKEIAESLKITASATVTKVGNNAQVTVTPEIDFKDGKDGIQITGTANVQVTGSVTFKNVNLVKESYRTQSVADLLKTKRVQDAGGTSAFASIPLTESDVPKLTKDNLSVYTKDLGDMFDLGDYLTKAQKQVDKRVEMMRDAITDKGGIDLSANQAVADNLSALAGKLAISNFAVGSGSTITLNNFSGAGYSAQLDGIIGALEQLRWSIVEAATSTDKAEAALNGVISALYGPVKGRLDKSESEDIDSFVAALAKAGAKKNPATVDDFYTALVDNPPAPFDSAKHTYTLPTSDGSSIAKYVDILKGTGIDIQWDEPLYFQFVMWRFDKSTTTVDTATLFG